MAKESGLGASKRRLISHATASSPIRPFRAKPPPMEKNDPAVTVESPCQACGACCAHSSDWPRFTTEDDVALDLIPQEFVNEQGSGMRCNGDRCAALAGQIGVATCCLIYAVRPEVCRTCMPGDPECIVARQRHGLPPLA